MKRGIYSHKPTDWKTSWVVWLGLFYLASILWLWWIHWTYVDDWWLATMLSYGPTYLYFLPIVFLVPAALVWHRRSLWILGTAALIILFPIMDLRVGSVGRNVVPPDSKKLRMLTCNVGRQLDLSRLKQVVESESVDLVLLQESPTDAAAVLKLDEKWNYKQVGELFVASRFEITGINHIMSPTSPWRPVALDCEILVEQQKLRVFCIHLMTMRPGLTAVLKRSRSAPIAITENNATRWSDAISVANDAPETGMPMIIAGDFNTTTEGRVFSKLWSKWRNAFSATGWGLGWTKFTRWHGVRIDHILGSECNFEDCRVLEDIGSDHRPLIAIVVIERSKNNLPFDKASETEAPH